MGSKVPRKRATWLVGLLAGLLLLSEGLAQAETTAGTKPAGSSPRGCPAEMVRVQNFCVDRWETSLVDDETNEPLSPYYPPSPAAQNRVLYVWQLERSLWGDERARDLPLPALSFWQHHNPFSPRAMSRPKQVPQGYLSRSTAEAACQRGGKRLCTLSEWRTACRGDKGRAFPYGDTYMADRCNVGRATHPAFVLHGNSSMGHLDPRLNLVVEEGNNPLLRETGQTKDCVSRWGDDGLWDMVGNIDEWVSDEPGIFVGGFYARPTTQGCDAKISSHAPQYFDYSTGTRCCRDAR
jgi:formylglycine-generating enzyme